MSIETSDPSEQAETESTDDSENRPSTPEIRKSYSLAGRKRGRDQVEDSPNTKIVPPRRTKSVGDVNRIESTERSALDEGYKRGMIRGFVKSALEGTIQGNDTAYRELTSHFLPSPTTPVPDLASLTTLLQALLSSVSLLSASHHSALVKAIIALPWASAGDEPFVRVYRGFLGVLCTARAEWISEVVNMTVRGLQWQIQLKTLPTSPQLSRKTYHARHISLITHLLSLIPTLPSVLGPALVKHFPFKRESELALEVYVRNVLGVAESCPEVVSRVWEGVVDRLIRLDVEIQIELEDMDEEEVDVARAIPTDPASTDDPLDRLVSEAYDRPDADELARLSNGDVDIEDLDIDDISSEEGSVDGDSVKEEKELDEKRYRRLHVLRSKVDAISTLFLTHLERIFTGSPGSAPSTSTQPLTSRTSSSTSLHKSYLNASSRTAHFQTLLSIFDRLILPTFQCRRAQFIVFWCCSLNSEYTDLFLGLLVSRALYERNQPAVNRVAAASYIASFVSRAKFIDDDQVRTVVQYLTAYLDGILTEARIDPLGVAASGGLTVFYTVCQAVMMIFCFRWRALQSHAGEETMADEMEMDDLEEDERKGDGNGWMADMDVLQKAVFSQLNPLMACYPIVVDMFAKIAHTTNFMFCYSVITANRSILESTHISHSLSLDNIGDTDLSQVLPLIGRQSLSDTSLDSFFPFDPYDLPRAKVFVDKYYRNWDEVALETEEDDEDDDLDTITGTDTEDDKDPSEIATSQSFSHKSNYIGIVGRAMRSGADDPSTNDLSTSLDGISLSHRQMPSSILA